MGTHQNLLSSIVNTAIGMVIMAFVIVMAIGVWLLIGFSGIDGFYEKLREVFPQIWTEFWTEVGEIKLSYVALFLGNVLSGSVCEVVLLMLSVTTGCIIAKKHKILAAVGMYYGIHFLISASTTVTLSTQVIANQTGAEIFTGIMSASMVQTAVVGVLGYFLMYWLTDRKLNLN